jgi:drug/metabolite transporter (DMT)-like permease
LTVIPQRSRPGSARMNSPSSTASAPGALTPTIIGCVVVTWLVWGSTYLAIRFTLGGFAPYFLMATRFIVAGAILLSWQRGRGAVMPTRRQWGNALVVGALMLGGCMGGVAYAEQTVPSSVVVAFIAVVPLTLVVFNRMLGLRPQGVELLAVLVGLCGVLMLTQGPGFHGSPAGLFAMMLGTTGWALGSVLAQRRFALAPGATGFATEMLCGGVVLLLISAVREETWLRHVPTGAWLAWLYLAVFGSLIAFSAYMLLLARTSASLATSYALVNPVVAMLLGVTVGGEKVSKWEWLSAGVILVGVMLLFVGRRRGLSCSGSGTQATNAG